MPVPTVAQFKGELTEFADYTDDDVLSQIRQAQLFIDVDLWDDTDYYWAIIYYAAHFLFSARLSTKTQNLLLGDASVYTSSLSFGDRKATFASRLTGELAMELLAADMETTRYGILFLRLQRRNIIPVAIV